MATIKTEEFKAAILALNAGIIPKNPSHSVLNCVAIILEEKAVTFTITDLTVWLEFKIELCENLPQEECGPISVPYSSMARLVNEITTKEVTLKRLGVDLLVECGKTTRSVSGMTDYFPLIDPPKQCPLGKVNIGRNEVNEVVAACSEYVSKDEAKGIITGINLRVDGDNNRAIAEATDGHIMVQAAFPVSSECEFSFVLPGDFPERLLKHKWQNLSITAYEDWLIATDETTNMRFQCLIPTGKEYPNLDALLKSITENAVASKIQSHDISLYLKPLKKGYKEVILLCDNKNLDVYAFDKTDCSNHKVIPREGNGFAWANVKLELLTRICKTPKEVKVITIHLAKDDLDKKRFPIAIEYVNKGYCFFFVIAQVYYPEETALRRKQDELVEFYSQHQEVTVIEAEVGTLSGNEPGEGNISNVSEGLSDPDNDGDTIDVDPIEIFGEAPEYDESDDKSEEDAPNSNDKNNDDWYWKDEDRPDGDQDFSE